MSYIGGGGGGGGTPGGLTTQIQFNDGGSFGGNSGFVFDKTNVLVTLGSATFGGPAAATLQLGSVDAASPVAQALKVQSVIAGTNNTAGADWTLTGSLSTGTGKGGDIVFKASALGSTGTTQNPADEVLRLSAQGPSPLNGTGAAGIAINTGIATGANGYIAFGGLNANSWFNKAIVCGYPDTQQISITSGGSAQSVPGQWPVTFGSRGLNLNSTITIQWGNNITVSYDAGLGRNAAGVVEVNDGSLGTFKDILVRAARHTALTVNTLPSPAVAGMVAYITDGDGSLAWGATAVNTGAGATPYLVWYNGTNWTVAGK